MDSLSLSVRVKELARQAGLDVVGITHARAFEGYALPSSRRRDPALSLPGARSIVVAGVYIGGYFLPAWDDPSVGRTSRLFLSGFYADVVGPLEPVADSLRREGFAAVVCDTFQSDTSVLPLKLAAVRAGIGWQGKNTLLLSPDYGSFLALGGILTDAPLEADEGVTKARCGNCRACVDACPTGALNDPYHLNRDRCVSSLLELEGPLGRDVHEGLGNQVIECDICQTACPWNAKHVRGPLPTSRTSEFRTPDNLRKLGELFGLPNLFELSGREYDQLIGPYRSGVAHNVFRRNVVAALGHAPRSLALPLLQRAAADTDSEVRRTAQVSLDLLVATHG